MEEQSLPSDYILFKHYQNLLEARIAQTELQKKNVDSFLFDFNGRIVEDPFVFQTGGGNLYVQKESYNSAASYLNPFKRGLRLFSKEIGFSSISYNSIISVFIANFILGFGVIFLSWGVNKFVIMSMLDISISALFALLSLGIYHNFAKPFNLFRIFFYTLFFIVVGLLELVILGAILGANTNINLPLIYIFTPFLSVITSLYWPIFVLLANYIIFLMKTVVRPTTNKVFLSESYFQEIITRYFWLQFFIFISSLLLVFKPTTRLIIFILILKTFNDIFFRLRWKFASPEIPL